MSRTTWVIGGLVVVGAAALALAAPRSRSVWERLRAVPEDFRAAYSAREAELRQALLPDDATVADARAAVARRRGGQPSAAGDDALPYEFF